RVELAAFCKRSLTLGLLTGLFLSALMCFSLTPSSPNNKLRFWLELNSIVDFFTIPPVCVSYYLKRNWLGLRFLRALRLLELPKILQFLKITRTSHSIKLSRLLAAVLSTWLTAAGFIHLVENSGDPWLHRQNSQSLSYFDCLYLTMVTMSTVGFGDVVTKTSLGRIFMIFFIIAGLVLFANFIPEIVDIVGGNQQYQDSYKVVRGRKYIVVCGDITLESVTAFLRNFLAQDTGDICTEIVFLGETLPSLELETVFKCYSAYTTFFHGSALNYKDLKRVVMGSADACLILADTCSSDPYHSLSVYLANIPNWDWRRGDSIVCLAELKLGFIAQSCLVPGLSTLLRSLFIRQKSTKVSPSLVQIMANFYCKACHSDIDNPELIKKCHCGSKLWTRSFSGNHQGQTTSPLHDHIVVCVFGDANSTLIGLRNFVMPLRASNFTYQELKDIVFVGSLEYMKREWKFIQNFPKLLLFPGSALSCADLRAVNIKYCTMCTILSSNQRASTNPTLVDTESILATLNIRSMQFTCKSAAGGKNFSVIGFSVCCDLPFQTYRNHHVLALLQTLVTGGTSPELEEQLAEKNMLCGSFSNITYMAPRARCKLALISDCLNNILVLFVLSLQNSFGDIYCKALDLFGILCFGLYRLTEEPNPYKNRGVYAIARPPSDFKMLPTDMLFCVVPFSTIASNDLSVCEEDLSPRRHQSHMDSSIKQNEVRL
uniref:BK channel n=1 Tax=Chelydra serpentina TaxID=8475 RepID=A0A8C3TKX0_CHESE